MKYLVFIAILLASCTQKTLIEKNIEKYIQDNAHVPESYEPISTKVIDTTEIYTNFSMKKVYIFEHKCRLNATLFGKMLTTYKVTTDTNFNILEFKEENALFN